MKPTKQKTLTIKPILGNSTKRRILYWTVTYKGKVLHSSSSIYSDADEITYYWNMRNYAVNNLYASHIKNWLTGSIEKVN